jgi:hypothetical protein
MFLITLLVICCSGYSAGTRYERRSEMNRQKIYRVICAFFLLSLVIVSVVAAAPEFRQLSKPRLLEPTANEIIFLQDRCGDIEFIWVPVLHATQYSVHIYRYDSEGRSWSPIDTGYSSGNSYTFATDNVFMEGTDYKWDVQAWGEPGYVESSQSRPKKFTVDFVYYEQCS